ncbi:uncharacterized protein LOC126898166 [Daktulosphaira vitifoliae]|uniref:uncharacterized protein LOC126898166 n=1 Tax=Daktulosphaira vitifoliae TaxID=58002 RepID=UPI0021A9EADF|nr:uncharacterized protein LOC126898166 [Daktulosphaira vitifoliae]
MRVSSTDDYCLKLQDDLNSFSESSNSMGLSLNLTKCKVFTYHRTKHPIVFHYSITAVNISRELNSTTDLGFKFSYNLDPMLHIDYVCCKAFKALGFIMRLAKDFKQGLSLKMLFCSIVRPILEYGSVVWDLYTALGSLQLERVQRKFLRFVSYSLDIVCPNHNHVPVSYMLGLSSLAERIRNAGINFLIGLLNGNIDSPSLLSLICFRVPQRATRNNAPFVVSHCLTNYAKNEPLRRLMSNANVDPIFSF